MTTSPPISVGGYAKKLTMLLVVNLSKVIKKVMDAKNTRNQPISCHQANGNEVQNKTTYF